MIKEVLIDCTLPFVCLTIAKPFSPIYLQEMKNYYSLVIFTHR